MFGFAPYSNSIRLLVRLSVPNRIRNGIRSSFLGEFWACQESVLLPNIRSFYLQIEVNDKQKQPFAVSYLINSCGFSRENALWASRRCSLKFETTDGPDAVLALLKDHGFNQTQILKLLEFRPHLLASDPQVTLLPKIEFFYSMGLSKEQLPDLLSCKPRLFLMSLKNTIIPWYGFLKRLLGYDGLVVSALKSPSWSLYGDAQENFASNILYLREVGVPESRIALLVIRQPRVLTGKREEFKQLVAEILEMGFGPFKYNFCIAMIAFSGYKRSTLEQKMDVYRGCGWSEDDIQRAIKFHPTSIILSEKKIVSGMNFLVKEMGWTPRYIARDPTNLFFSLNKRIIPRCSVIQVLLSKGFIKKKVSLGTILKIVERRFVENYVTKYQSDLPQLLDVYQGKVAAADVIGPT